MLVSSDTLHDVEEPVKRPTFLIIWKWRNTFQAFGNQVVYYHAYVSKPASLIIVTGSGALFISGNFAEDRKSVAVYFPIFKGLFEMISLSWSI